MTEGSPIKLIFAFAIPMLIGNVFQQLYNMDSIVVEIIGKTPCSSWHGISHNIFIVQFLLV